MPRFFYDVDDQGRRVHDKLGIDQIDIVHALHDATFIVQLLASKRQSKAQPGVVSVTIRSENGTCLYEACATLAFD